MSTTTNDSTNWLLQVSQMHEKFGVYDIVDTMDAEKLNQFLRFREVCIREEIDEFKAAIDLRDSEGAVDALVDAAVFILGTLDLFCVDGHEAWRRVHEANMNKTPGIKVSTDGKPVRPNPFGFSDLIKPAGWTPPSHTGNHGLIEKALQ